MARSGMLLFALCTILYGAREANRDLLVGYSGSNNVRSIVRTIFYPFLLDINKRP